MDEFQLWSAKRHGEISYINATLLLIPLKYANVISGTEHEPSGKTLVDLFRRIKNAGPEEPSSKLIPTGRLNFRGMPIYKQENVTSDPNPHPNPPPTPPAITPKVEPLSSEKSNSRASSKEGVKKTGAGTDPHDDSDDSSSEESDIDFNNYRGSTASAMEKNRETPRSWQ